MSLESKTLKLCSCNGTMPLDAKRLGAALKLKQPVTIHRELCRKEAAQFQSALTDPHIRALAERVTITVGKDRPTPLAAVVTVTLKDGRVLTRTVAGFKGTPEQPLDGAELREKFLLLTRHCTGSDMGAMFERLQNLENERDLDWIGVRAN